MNRSMLITLIASLCLLSVGCAPAKYSPDILPRNTQVDASVKLPINESVAVYIPKVYRDWGYHLKGSRKRVEAGKGLVSGVHAAGRKFFTNMKDFDPNSNDTFSLLLDLDPSWVARGGKITFTFDYQLLNASHTIMHHGRESFTANIDMRSPETAVENAVIRASQKIYVDIVNTLHTQLEAPYTTARMSDVNGELLVNRNRNAQAFTTFKINKNGQLLSAGYAMDGCVIAELETKTGTSYV
ncbi:MAG: hypothetical protein VXZ35_00615, partial [Pseudomonadota bacterium]|nr:hypothetical protein [Pseudomonadota bacterium]